MSNMSNQFELYSLSAPAFFTDEESNKKYIVNKLTEDLKGAEKQLTNSEDDDKYVEIFADMCDINFQIVEAKEELKFTIANHPGIRHLREDALTLAIKDTDERKLNKQNIISMFPSILSRTLGLEMERLTLDIMIFESSYTDVLESLIKLGFMYGDELYIPYTASAGQIRSEKVVFIKKSVLDEHADSIMCGLSVERINKSEYNGANINKYLAYLALGQSACSEWEIDLNRCIVVDDFETLVNGVVDFINRNTYEITPKRNMDIPIPHTDGCGLILPVLSDKNFQFRMPWFKGLLAVMPFDLFVDSYEGATTKVIDIWNRPWDIVEDNIQIIFTKSQFKMWKYYSSWQEYKDLYKLHKCQSGICSEDEERDNAQFGYQMLQTLVDCSKEELEYIASKTIHDINMAGSDKETMLKILGVGEGEQTYIQQALALLPELAADKHSVDNIKDTRRSMINRARFGKLEIDAKYTFLIPDLYAFCERLFAGIEIPKGLLADGEVYCSLYPESERLLVLRYPHLYREHSINNNMVDEVRSKWFLTNGMYTSSFSIISKLLQFDVDGDDALVVADKKIIEIADRNMKNDNIVPLYYEMATAEARIINNNSIFEGLSEAFKGSGKIGIYSNAISKLWNSENPNLKVIKWLVMENNFSIDQAKTLYMPKRPDDVNEEIMEALGVKQKNGKIVNYKLPRFFKFAKDKSDDEVELKNNSVVNRLMDIIPSNNIRFKDVVGKLDYKMLMNTTRQKKNDNLENEIIKQYDICLKNKGNQTKYAGVNLKLINREIRQQLLTVCKDKSYLVNVLVTHLYTTKNKSKIILWDCFGKEIVENIKRNNGVGVCAECKEDYEITKQRQCRCNSCQKEYERRIDAKRKKEKRGNDLSGRVANAAS
ncbi:hypothetical protein H1230_13280 [Paenibacillus sp. 19GGS1-52]|uniref:hypothetical protein n=1 Tax=Paenibacillus sp. 19GGS1-52 TaxID=2758563 RepID=UPI001EFBA7D8|nr:hypothetical protein [Paenibacillus sp. 19GGS1-52]ULO09653.1 hypothetical protein H1230_13280 [Paenibacillus sp. 19GGS1-52]